MRRAIGLLGTKPASLGLSKPASFPELNAQAGYWVSVDQDLFEVIAAAKRMAARTGGLFNPFILPALIHAGYDRDFAEVQASPSAQASAPFAEVAHWRKISLYHGARAVRIPPGSALDLGGIAKGWSAEQVADRLSAYGACLVDAGGDLVTRGDTPNQSGWNINCRRPTGSGHRLG